MKLMVAPYFMDDTTELRYRQSMKNWSRKLDRLDDEMLIYVRERINYLLEERSLRYMEELEQQLNNEENICL